MQKLGNTSSAVMQQRAKPRGDGLDDFPTPSWAVRAFLHHILARVAMVEAGEELFDLTAWGPACNRGYMARPLAESFADVVTTDVHDYGWIGQRATFDFLMPGLDIEVTPVDWIITNPPFRLAADFAERCLQIRPRRGFALLTRVAFLEGSERYETLFSKYPPAIVAQYAERVPMVEGRYDPKASTATAYAWLVWRTDTIVRDTAFRWIPPSKARFFRPADVNFETRETSHV